ncbi:DMT family transporter [Thioalkalivibrio sp. HK1]|uniref:DMT family transporter n=1 Tax=Thioalkalivibrio sp. HK1 TaxID=1469245 RepID=UPI0004705BA6|nr:DMT family transporter [Thioalkalivibrio sp. HK1]
MSSPSTRSSSLHSRGAAIAWMSGALVSFLTMAISSRELSAELTIVQILFLRSLLCLSLLGFIILVLGVRRPGAHWGFGRILTRAPSLHLVRNTVHWASQYAWTFAAVSIPLAEVFAIEFTSPIWTALIATFVLGERLNRWRLVAIALGFVGTMIILRPGVAVIHPASFSALAAAVGFAITYVVTKKLVSIEYPIAILFWMNVTQLLLGAVPAALLWVSPTSAMWPWIAALGIAGLSSHYCLSRALRCADATVVAPMDFLRLPVAAVVAWLMYAEALDPFVFIGAVIIFTGNWIGIRRG